MANPALLPVRVLILPVLLVIAAATDIRAAGTQNDAEAKLKASLNSMVQEVRQAESPAAKREILQRFAVKAARGAAVAERVPFQSREARAALASLQEKFAGYAAELGKAGQGENQGGVVDGDLDDYASFMQQDLEMAAMGGGIYLSVGAVIIILLLLLLLL